MHYAKTILIALPLIFTTAFGITVTAYGAPSDHEIGGDGARTLRALTLTDADTTVIGDSIISDGLGSLYRKQREWLQTELGASYDYLDNKSYKPWTSVYLDAAYPFGDRKTVYGHVEYLNEYSLSDGDAFAGVYYPIFNKLTVVAEGELGFAHIITPVWSLFGQLEYKLFPGFLISAGLRNSEYRDAAGVNNEIQLWNGTGEYWYSNYRMMYTFYESRGNGGIWNPPSHLIEVGYYYGDANSISLGAAMGHEVDRVPINDNGIPISGDNFNLNTYDTKTVFLLGRDWFNPAWGMSYEIHWYQMNFPQLNTTLYNRYGIRLGIRHRFGYAD